jgi:hypothetical protein
VDHRSPEADAAGPLRGGGKKGRRGGDATLEMARPDPGAVEAEAFAALEQPKRPLESKGRIVVGEIAGRQEGDVINGHLARQLID